MKAYYNAPGSGTQVFFGCVEFKWDGKKYFISSPTYYWPVAGTVDFFAASPVSVSSSDASRFAPDSTMDVRLVSGKTDFIAAMYPGGTRCQAIQMKFGHKLTKLSFKVKATDATLRYEIRGIDVVADSSATYHFGKTVNVEGMPNNQSWTDRGTQHDTVSYRYFNTSDVQSIAAGTSGAQAIAGGLMLLPKQSSAKVRVSYKALCEGYTVADAVKTVSIDTTLHKWGINKHICYVLNLTPDATPITFTAESTGWDQQADVEITPQKPTTAE